MFHDLNHNLIRSPDNIFTIKINNFRNEFC